MQSVNFIHFSRHQSCFLMNSSTLEYFYGPSSGLVSTAGLFLLVYIREGMRKTALLSQGSQGFECCGPKSKKHESSWVISLNSERYFTYLTYVRFQSEHVPPCSLNLIQPVIQATIWHSQSHPGNLMGSLVHSLLSKVCLNTQLQDCEIHS